MRSRLKEMIKKPSHFSSTSNPALPDSHPDPAPATTMYRVVDGGTGVGVVVDKNVKNISSDDDDMEIKGNISSSEMEIKKNISSDEIEIKGRDLGKKIGGSNIKLLQLLEVWGALGVGQLAGFYSKGEHSSGQLMALFFNESFKYRGRAYMRLRRLQGKGLIQVWRPGYEKQVYGLTELGHRVLRRTQAARLSSFAQKISPRTLEHRIIATGVGLAVGHFLKQEVVTERQAYHRLWRNLGSRPEGFHIPDLVVEANGARFPIEVELSRKEARRYDSIWDFYRDRLQGSDRALYLTRTACVARNLRELAGAKGAPFLYFSDLESFRRTLGRNPYVNCDGQETRLS